MVKSSPEQSTNKLISAAMDSHTKIVPPVKSFTLKSSSTDFESRSINIFSSLSTLENNHQTWMSHNETLESFEDDSINEPIRSSPDVFKKPFAPLPLKRNVLSSRNKRNRKKWIKYSLEDIPLSSDATNTAVAFQFLRELRKKKAAEETAVSSSVDKLIFCKPMAPKNYSRKNRETSSLCSTSKNEENSNQESQSSETDSGQIGKCVTSSVKLMHLEDEFDDAQV